MPGLDAKPHESSASDRGDIAQLENTIMRVANDYWEQAREHIARLQANPDDVAQASGFLDSYLPLGALTSIAFLSGNGLSEHAQTQLLHMHRQAANLAASHQEIVRAAHKQGVALHK